MSNKKESAANMKIRIEKMIHWENTGTSYKRIDDLFMCTIDTPTDKHSFNERTKEEFLIRVMKEISLRLC